MSEMTTLWSEQDWWKSLPCPLHPSWELGNISELDLHKLKQNVDTDENGLMVVELAIYRAFLEFPRGTFYNKRRNNPTEALTYLGMAEEYVSTKFQENADAVIGYGIIINTFHLWIKVGDLAESLLRDLIARKDDHPDHESYINIVQAYIRSRLGPRWRNRALLLYESALEHFPDNCEWLFGKALMLGREARQVGFIKGWKNQEVQEKFQKEKDILKRILDLDPDFNLARAFYGQVLFSLGEKGAGEEISRALQKEPQNRSIAMVAVRYHRRNGTFRWAEIILQRLLETCNTAETNFQLGILYNSETRFVPFSERSSLWRTALNYFEKGIELDVCHYPCYTKRAEMNALLGETRKAHALFEELFDHIYKDQPYLATNEMHTIVIALEMRLSRHMKVFTTEELIKLSHRYISLATEEDFVTIDDSADGSLVRGKIEKRLEKLKEIISDDYEKDDVRRLATLKLADANRRLGKFENAEQLYMEMHMQVKGTKDEIELIWGLGKCYLSKGFNDKATVMAIQLERVDQTGLSAHEIYADVHLSMAKSEMSRETGLCVDDVPCPSAVIEHLENAIDMGSLEACYLFLTKVPNLHQNYFSLELRVPEILAKIRLTCGNEKLRTFHSHFKVIMSDGSEIIHDEMINRNEIMEKVNELLRYVTLINKNACSSEEVVKEYKQLELLRQARLEFECEILKRKEGECWNNACKEKLTEVLRIARVVLDHIVHIYQTLVLEKPPGRSLFAIHFDWNKARVDTDLTKAKLQNWTRSSFPGYHMPENTFKIILEVQPMYDKDNLWLAALGSFNSTVKHKSFYVGEETFDLELEEAEWIRLKSEDIARKSCKEVERLVLYFLSMFNTLKRNTESEYPKSGNNGEKGSDVNGGERKDGVRKRWDEEEGKGMRRERKKGEGKKVNRGLGQERSRKVEKGKKEWKNKKER